MLTSYSDRLLQTKMLFQKKKKKRFAERHVDVLTTELPFISVFKSETRVFSCSSQVRQTCPSSVPKIAKDFSDTTLRCKTGCPVQNGSLSFRQGLFRNVRFLPAIKLRALSGGRRERRTVAGNSHRPGPYHLALNISYVNKEP